jgi:hypothetical protein
MSVAARRLLARKRLLQSTLQLQRYAPMMLLLLLLLLLLGTHG